MANASVILNGASIQVISSSDSSQLVSSSAGNPTLTATEVFYNAYVAVGTGSTSLTLPATTVWVVWVRNLSTAATLSVTPTPASGGSPLTYILPPGGVFAYWCPSEGSGGINAVSLQGSASLSAEVLLAA